jgi:hypothetical protein
LRKKLKGLKDAGKGVVIAGKKLNWDAVVDVGMAPLLCVDMAASASVWMAAYQREIATLSGRRGKGIDPQGAYHAQAVRAADRAVKKVNPDYDSTSRSFFSRSKGLESIFNMFSSAVTLFAQRRRYAWQAYKADTLTLPQYARYELFDVVLPAVAMTLILSILRGSDDDEEIKDLLADNLADMAAMRLPIVGAFLAGILAGWGERSMRTVYSEPVRLVTKTKTAVDKGDPERIAAAMADWFDFVARVPVFKTARRAGKGYEQWREGEGTPFSVLSPRPERR